MFNPHLIIASRGLEAARKLASTKSERNCVEAAAAIRDVGSCTPSDVGYAGLACLFLPHKNLDRAAIPDRWEGGVDDATYIIDSGRYRNGDPIGIPYGSKARIILIYLITAAFSSETPAIGLGSSFYKWLRTMSNRKLGGMTYRLFEEQARRIGAMTVHAKMNVEGDFFAPSGQWIEQLSQGNENSDGEPLYTKRHGESAFPSNILLDRTFWLAAREHAHPIRFSALRQLSNNSSAIDLYVWFSYRLPRLTSKQSLGWPELYAMFGTGYRYPSQMRRHFIETLNLVFAVYPEAHLEIHENGLILYKSPAPTASLTMSAAE